MIIVIVNKTITVKTSKNLRKNPGKSTTKLPLIRETMATIPNEDNAKINIIVIVNKTITIKTLKILSRFLENNLRKNS
jgi:hypothetical protein